MIYWKVINVQNFQIFKSTNFQIIDLFPLHFFPLRPNSLIQRFSFFSQFFFNAFSNVVHRNVATSPLECRKWTITQHIDNSATGYFIIVCKGFEFDIWIEFYLTFKGISPKPESLLIIRCWEKYNWLESTTKGCIHICFQVGSQNNYTRKVFDPLQQRSNFLIGMSVLTVACCSPLSE